MTEPTQGGVAKTHHQPLDSNNSRIHINRVNQRLRGTIAAIDTNTNYEGLFNNLPHDTLKSAVNTNTALARQLEGSIPLEKITILNPDGADKGKLENITAQYFDLRSG